MIKLIHGDCLDFIVEMEREEVDVIITDPPYMDCHRGRYELTPIEFLGEFECRQLVFWSAREEFALDYTAIHIWDKKVGCQSCYERIFERNGGNLWRVFNHYLINSTVAAQYCLDEWTGHKAQKPLKLMDELVRIFTREGDVIFDPFMGTGSTGISAVRFGRSFIGVEIEERFYDIARRRISEDMGLINEEKIEEQRLFKNG